MVAAEWKAAVAAGALIGLLAAERLRERNRRAICRRMARDWVEAHMPIPAPRPAASTLEQDDIDLE